MRNAANETLKLLARATGFGESSNASLASPWSKTTCLGCTNLVASRIWVWQLMASPILTMCTNSNYKTCLWGISRWPGFPTRHCTNLWPQRADHSRPRLAAPPSFASCPPRPHSRHHPPRCSRRHAVEGTVDETAIKPMVRCVDARCNKRRTSFGVAKVKQQHAIGRLREFVIPSLVARVPTDHPSRLAGCESICSWSGKRPVK